MRQVIANPLGCLADGNGETLLAREVLKVLKVIPEVVVLHVLAANCGRSDCEKSSGWNGR
jgi:hypothetical protein